MITWTVLNKVGSVIDFSKGYLTQTAQNDHQITKSMYVRS